MISPVVAPAVFWGRMKNPLQPLWMRSLLPILSEMCQLPSSLKPGRSSNTKRKDRPLTSRACPRRFSLSRLSLMTMMMTTLLWAVTTPTVSMTRMNTVNCLNSPSFRRPLTIFPWGAAAPTTRRSSGVHRQTHHSLSSSLITRHRLSFSQFLTAQPAVHLNRYHSRCHSRHPSSCSQHLTARPACLLTGAWAVQIALLASVAATAAAWAFCLLPPRGPSSAPAHLAAVPTAIAPHLICLSLTRYPVALQSGLLRL